MKQPLAALFAVGALLLVHGLIDRYERITDDRIAYARWVADSCLPNAEGQRAVSRIEDGRLHCATFDNVGYGRAAIAVSAATMEIPQ